MDEQLKALLEGINALKSDQEETMERMENMQKSQEETKNELKEGMQKGLEDMQKGQERMQKCQEDLKNTLEKKIDNVEEKINSVEEKIALKVKEKIAVFEEKIEKKVEQVEERIREQVDERIEEVPVNFSQRVEDLEKKLLACEKMNENKFVPTSAVPVPASPVSVKLSTYDGKRTGKESLQEYASEVERLANLAFSDHPATVREAISLQYFVDGLKDGEIQKAERMADVQDLKSALLYVLELEAATQASLRERQSI
ncbi:uncharacterized protein TNCV_2106421 [Trichonephila clavipes]|nr:uncharacterized protein TNCV_2106421 [Trichonephila clavipes]